MNKPRQQIQPLQEHLTPSQKSTLVGALTFGEQWKEIGEMCREDWRISNNGNDFRLRLWHYPQLLKNREKENEASLEALNYHIRSDQARKKFLEEYVNDYLIYNWEPVEGGDSESVILRDIEQLDHLDNKRMTLNTESSGLGIEWSKALAQHIKRFWWLRKGVRLQLYWSSLGAEALIIIANAIKETGGLPEWVYLDLSGNAVWWEGMESLMEMIKKTWWLPAGTRLDLRSNPIWIVWVELLANTLIETWWLKEWVEIYLHRTASYPWWIEVMLDAVEKTGGMPLWSIISFKNPVSPLPKSVNFNLTDTYWRIIEVNAQWKWGFYT